MMRIESTQLGLEGATRVLKAVLGTPASQDACVLLPTWMSTTAEALTNGLRGLGLRVQLALLPPPEPSCMSVTECADLWIPSEPGDADLIVLCGVRPWANNVDGDHLIEIEAMQRRERLLSEGRRLLFIDWPRGARRDAEVDLRPHEMFGLYRRAYDIDYDVMRSWNATLSHHMKGASKVHITCPLGTDVHLSVEGRSWLSEDCALSDSEPAVYLPGGEIYTAVVEESAQGTVVFHHVGEPRIATFRDGILVAVQDRLAADDRSLAEEMGIGVEPLCELGIGTNPYAPPWQVGTLYEKSAGTVHVAVGGNAHFGGSNPSPRHMDLIIREPTLRVDDTPILLPAGLWKPKESA